MSSPHPSAAQPCASFDLAAEPLRRNEGGLVNDPNDPGGITNHGISLRWLLASGELQLADLPDGDIDHDGDIDAADIRAMTWPQAREFYRVAWWERYRYARFAQPVATKVLDMSVNMGARQAHILVQRACRDCGQMVSVDGILGDGSAHAINSIAPERFMQALRSRSAVFYNRLAAKKPTLAKYLTGWLWRAAQ